MATPPLCNGTRFYQTSSAALTNSGQAVSGGICLQNWLDLAKAEFGTCICRTLGGGVVDDATFPIRTRIGFSAGEHSFEFPGLSRNQNLAMGKGHIDLRWELNCAECAAIPSWIEYPQLMASWASGLRNLRRRKPERTRVNESFQRDRARSARTASRCIGRYSSAHARTLPRHSGVLLQLKRRFRDGAYALMPHKKAQ